VEAIAEATGAEATGRGEADTEATAEAEATGEAGEGGIPLGKMQQLQRDREEPSARSARSRCAGPTSASFFNEESRSFRSLCGACYSQVRRLNWVRERS